VTASLVLFFLPDPVSALRAWRRLLRPAGRVGVSTFGERDEAWRRVDELFAPYLPPDMLDARTSGRAGPFTSDAGVEDLLRSAGYDGVRTVGAEFSLVLSDAVHWQSWSRSLGQRQMWDAVPAEAHPAILEAAGELLEPLRRPDGLLHLRQRVRFTLGRAGRLPAGQDQEPVDAASPRS